MSTILEAPDTFIVILVMVILHPLFAQEEVYMPAPGGNATAQVGFNYDYLRDPLSVNFNEGLGYFSFNLPLTVRAGRRTMNTYFKRINERTSDGKFFTPEIELQQFTNTTLRADIPLFGGIFSFSHINIFKLHYANNLGVPSVLYHKHSITDDNDTLDLTLRGALNVPANLRLGWEALSFGYAYQFDSLWTLSFTMSRHSFYFDLYGNVDLDILGTIAIRSDDLNKDVGIDYSLHSIVDGYYNLTRWTPTVALKVWRFSCIARFGFKDEAEGSLVGDYEVPFFVNPKTFQPDPNLKDPQYLIDNIDRFENNEVTHVNLSTQKPIHWELPHGFTIKFDIIPRKLMFSYTKFSGDIRFELQDTAQSNDTNLVNEVISINSVTTVDHILLLTGRYDHIFFNLGIFSLETSFNSIDHVLKKSNFMPNYGGGVLVPITTLGFILGQKFEVLGEADIFPFAAFKLGFQYHF